MNTEEHLQENAKIEEAIYALQKEPTEEMLAHTLTVLRRQMRENGHLIVSLDQDGGSSSLKLRTLHTPDGASWLIAFTSFEEQIKGSDPVMSAFTAEIGKLFALTLETEDVRGLILNPWNCTLMLDKQLIRVICKTVG